MSHMSTADFTSRVLARELEELRRVGRECAGRGLVVARQGNISVRLGSVVHITAAGSDLGALGDRDIVSVGRHDRGAAGDPAPSIELPLHARIYEEHDWVGAIVHTHSPYATAWTYLGEPLGAGSRELRPPVDRPVLTAADAPPGSEALARAAADALGDGSAVLLSRHGVVGVGATPAEALEVCVLVEHHARVALLVRSAGAVA